MGEEGGEGSLKLLLNKPLQEEQEHTFLHNIFLLNVHNQSQFGNLFLDKSLLEEKKKK